MIYIIRHGKTEMNRPNRLPSRRDQPRDRKHRTALQGIRTEDGRRAGKAEADRLRYGSEQPPEPGMEDHETGLYEAGSQTVEGAAASVRARMHYELHEGQKEPALQPGRTGPF